MADAETNGIPDAVSQVNDEIQDWCRDHPGDVPPDLQRLIDLLDVVINGP